MANPQKLRARIKDLSFVGDQVCLLRLHSEAKVPKFKPGQFLHLALDAYDPSNGFWPESRVFSIASAPTDREIVIAYSVKGVFTSRMKTELRVGKEIWIKLPYGSFIIDEIVGLYDPVILVAGGTGITAFISFLDKEAIAHSPRKIHLFYGVRNDSLLLFAEQLSHAANSCCGFSLSVYVESASGAAGPNRIHGPLSTDNVIRAQSELGSASIFLAGPPVMIDSFQRTFSSAGVQAEKIHIDEWE